MNVFNKPNAGFHAPVQTTPEEPARTLPAETKIVGVRIGWPDLWRLAWQSFVIGACFALGVYLVLNLFGHR